MREGWNLKNLGELCELIGGGTPSKSNSKFYHGDIPWATVRDMRHEILSNTEFRISSDAVKKSSTNIIKKGNVIIATRVGLGKACILKHDTAINQDLKGVVPRNTKELTVGYLFHWIKSVSDQIEKAGTGATVQGVKLSFIESLQIPLPPLPEQQRIVALLDEAFAAIAKAKANTEKNLLNARELFESYLEGVFEDGRKKWNVVKVRDVSKVIGGFSFKSREFVHKGKYQVLRMGNVRPGIIREEENPVFIDSLGEAALKKSLLKRNDIIITQTGTKNKRDYGFTAIVDKDNYLLNQRIASVRFNKDYLPKFFLYFSWTKIFKDQFFANETGTVGQGNVGIGAITEALIPECSTGEQKLLVEQLEFIENQTKKLEAHYQQKLVSLEELKKSILQKAFRGELTEKEIVV